MSHERTAPLKRWWVWGVAVVTLAAIVAALLLFKPWLLFVNVQVNDAIPQTTSQPATPPAADSKRDSGSPGGENPVTPTQAPTASLVSTGSFISHEHETTGTASIVLLPDGRRQLVFENLNTTSGPDIHVWLSAGPVIEGGDGWFTAGQYEHVDLGISKGNLGNHVYDIPADVDLAAFPTVDLWCQQFGVSFGAAALTAQ